MSKEIKLEVMAKEKQNHPRDRISSRSRSYIILNRIELIHKIYQRYRSSQPVVGRSGTFSAFKRRT